MTEKNDSKKKALIAILKILREYTDENHYLTYQEIRDKLLSLYGINLARKAIADDIKILTAFDYNINAGENHVGVALFSRWDPSQVQYLIDSLFSSHSLPKNVASEIVENLLSDLSVYQRESYDSYKALAKSQRLNMTDNKETFYNIATILQAIKKGKQITFRYLAYDKKGNKTYRYSPKFRYHVSPYYTVNSFGKYYLLCAYRSGQNLSHYRIDYMKDIEIDNTPSLDRKEVPELKDFRIDRYLSEHIYLFGGEVIECKLKILKNEKDRGQPMAIRDVKDWFGPETKIIYDEKTDTSYALVQAEENFLTYWVMQYGSTIEVMSPLSFREKIKKELIAELARYQDE